MRNLFAFVFALFLFAGGAHAYNEPLSASAIATQIKTQSGCSTAGYTWVPASNTCVAPQTLNAMVALNGWGDSYMTGAGATLYNVTSYFWRAAADVPAPATNYGVGGTTMAQINTSVFANYAQSTAGPILNLTNGGENEDNTGGTCTNTTGACGISFGLMLNAIDTWLSIPEADRIRASNATKTGTWTIGSDLYTPTLTTSFGQSETSTVSGSTLTFSVPSSASGKIGVIYKATQTGNGTFTALIDGVLQTDACSSSTTYTAGSCGGVTTPSLSFNSATGAFYRQEYTVTPNQAHTVVITTTNAATVEIVGVDWLPPAGAANVNPVFEFNVIAAWGSYATWNSVIATQIAAISADGLPVYLVDLINGTPGVNSTTDLSATATSACPATTFGGHPNDCGYLKMYQTLKAVEVANNYVVGSNGAGGKSTQLTGVLNVPFSLGSVNPYQTPLTHSQVFSFHNDAGNTLPRGVDFYRANGNIFNGVGTWLNPTSSQPWSAKNAVGLYSGTGFGFWFCVANASGTLTTANSSTVVSSQACFDYSGDLYVPSLISAGTKFATSGCAVSSTTGGATAGTYTSGTSGTCTTVITMAGATGITAPNGWDCRGNDRTAGTVIAQTASTTTTATLSGSTTSGDVISFSCTGY